jgi:four helix bundle protein
MGESRDDLPQRTFEFAKRIVKLCRALDQTPGVSRALTNQLLRSGTSVGANVEEGRAGQSRADFISKYAIACKEARESHYWLRLLVASEIVDSARLRDLIDEADQLIAILTTIIKSARANTPTPARSKAKAQKP